MRKYTPNRRSLYSPSLTLAIGLLLPLLTTADTNTPTTASKVEIISTDGLYSLSVNGQPFNVKGVGMGFARARDIDSLVAAGGNAFRTWETDRLDEQLATAVASELMVLVGLDVKKELQGFDYNDAAAVARQFNKVTATVDKYKNHPNVLGWIIVNEPNLMIGSDGQAAPVNAKVYNAIGDIVEYIHKHDSNHPATIAFAFTASLAEDIKTALARAPALDFISLQAYGALPAIPDVIQQLSLDRPFMVTEYGPLGHWEMPSTDWGREIEEPSGVKATGMVERMQGTLLNDASGKLIGSFAFLWGQKQERTPTWYGMFVASGERTAMVDELTRIWTGEYPENRVPSAWRITLDNKQPTDSIRLTPGQQVTVRVDVDDPENDPLDVRWQLMTEVVTRSQGGHIELEPASVPLTFEPTEHGKGYVSTKTIAPDEPGEYRLFAYATDNQGGVATANIPFLLEAVMDW
ncbi:MAG: hypothetical protein V3U76_00785 [Granulosicoccus sp.]